VNDLKSEVGPVVVPKEWDFRLRQATPRQDAAARMRPSTSSDEAKSELRNWLRIAMRAVD
jgi:hypothetical protein